MKTKFNPFLRSALLTAAATALAASSAHAADVTITGSSAINGMNTNYTVNSPDALILDITGVGGNRATDTMGAAIAKAGGDLTIDGSGTLRVTGGSGDVLGIADVSSRTVNISLGSGGLIDIQGGAFVNGGWGGGVWTDNYADMNIASGAIFDVWDGTTPEKQVRIDALIGAGSVQNGSNSNNERILTVGVDGGSGTFSGVIGGGTGRVGNNKISLTKEGSGTQTLSNTNTYTGTTTVNQGTLAVTIQDGLSSASAITVASGATLKMDAASNNRLTINTGLTLNGGTLAAGTGTLVTNYRNYYLNTAGSITAGNNAVSTISGGLSLNGRDIYNDNGGFTKVTVDSGSTLNITGAVGGVSGVSWGGISKYGAGTLTLSNYNTSGIAQGMYITAGTVVFSNNSLGLRNASSPHVGYAADFQGNATLQWAPGNTQDISGGSGSYSPQQIKIADGVTATLDTGANNVTLATAFAVGSSGTGAMTKTGSGTLTLSGANTYIGNTTVSEGTLVIADNAQLKFVVSDSASTTVTGTGTAAFNGEFLIDTSAVTGTAGGIWTLVNRASLTGETFDDATFKVVGYDDTDNDGVWTTTDAKGTWSFSEITGELTLDVGNDYDSWKTDNGVTGTENQDDDGDGLTNHEEYAFGLDPTGGSSVNPIAVPFSKTSGKFSYTRRDTSLPDPTLDYSVWYSTDMATWAEDTGAIEGTPTLSGEVETVEVTVSSALLSNPKLFIQVRAQ